MLLIVILFPVIYWINGFESKTIKSSLLLITILISLSLAFILFNIVLFFIAFESLIIFLLLMLLLICPSYYRIRTGFFFFIYSLCGSIWFLFSIVLFIYSSFYLLLLVLIPFLIKMPSFLSIIDYPKYIVKLILQYHYYLLDYY